MHARPGWLLIVLAAALAAPATPAVYGQSSSMMRLPAHAAPVRNGMTHQEPAADAGGSFTALPPKELSRPGTRAIEMTSMIAVPPVPARKFKVHDLVNILVSQQKKYAADGKTNSKKEWKIDGKLEEWFRMYPRNRLGASTLSEGPPGFKFNTKNENKMDGENEREDKFTTRIQASIIDVKPNGNLVLEAKQEEQHDEEHFTITLTGVCRADDVTATNTIMSTQIANLVLVEKNKGAVRDATTRGWFPRILDFTKPF